MTDVELRVERLRQTILEEGYGRVVLLGTEEQMTSPAIRRPLAASGILVLVPGADDRALLCNAEEAVRIALHGIEHGARAIVVADSTLLSTLERSDIGVPLLAF